jgi:hypothetical protein
MKKCLIILSFLLIVPIWLSGQSSDPLMKKCAMSSGPNTTFLKDFRIQLGKGSVQPELRFKQVFPLSNNMTYKFTLCNSENSAGKLILKIKDSDGSLQASSYVSGKAYPEISFTCKKTGTYNLYFDFLDFQPGLGVGIVSLVK